MNAKLNSIRVDLSASFDSGYTRVASITISSREIEDSRVAGIGGYIRFKVERAIRDLETQIKADEEGE